MRTVQLKRLSPETLEMVNELYRKPGFLERSRTEDRAIAVIEEIGLANEPAAIRELMPFGLSRDGSVAVAAKSAIFRLFAAIRIEALPVLDDSLRHSWGHLEDWYGLRVESLKGLQLKNDSDRVFLGLVASHRSGYVRADAIRMMASDRSEILLPFVLIRLTDWVDAVRAAAERELCARLEATCANRFVECLALMDRLAASTRFRQANSIRVDELLKPPQCGPAIQEGMSLPERAVRRHCFRLAASNPQFLARDVILRAVSDTDVLIRKWAFNVGPDLLPKDRDNLRERAAKDSYGPIRRLAFETLKANENTRLEDLLSFLLDRSTSIRQDCQSVVKRRGASPAEFYRTRIQSSTKNSDICILGLAETGTPQDEAAIRDLGGSPSPRIRRTVIRALRIMKAALKPDDLLTVVSGDVPSVAREAAWTLLVQRISPAESVWAAASKNPDYRVRTGVLKLLRPVGKWTQIRLYLEAAADSEAGVSNRAISKLSQWVQKFNTSFVQPTVEDKRVISELIEAARGRLPAELASELTLITETAPR